MGRTQKYEVIFHSRFLKWIAFGWGRGVEMGFWKGDEPPVAWHILSCLIFCSGIKGLSGGGLDNLRPCGFKDM